MGLQSASMNAIFVPTITHLLTRAWRHVAVVSGVVVVVFGAGLQQAGAELADRQQPMLIEADALRVDDATQTSVFTGNVVMTKGSIVLRGQQIEVRQNAQGDQFGTIQGSGAQLAFFRQKREGVDEFVEGEAERIDYNSQTDTVTFTGQAVLRRFRGATLSDQTLGARIVYNGSRETFVVDSGRQSATPDNPSGRVRALLSPNPASDGATPAPASGPVLAPSTRMEPRP